VDVILLVGGRSYLLPAASARTLADRIRHWSSGRSGLHDAERSLTYLADTIDEDLAAGESPEPIELGWKQAEALIENVLRDDFVDGDDDLTRLWVACRRFSGELPPAV
jgi:hypothetical protein